MTKENKTGSRDREMWGLSSSSRAVSEKLIVKPETENM
jgi:hypothetical protein